MRNRRLVPARGRLLKLLLLAFLCPAVSGAVPAGPADEILRSLDDEGLRQLAVEILERNPSVARARARAAAAAVRAPQVRALPDPVASLSLFVLPPETRVGPQRLSLAVSQKLPWFGKLALHEQAALYEAAAATAAVEAERLRVLTEAHRLLHELAFQDAYARITREEREHLLRHEEIARARYSAGLGLQQQVIRVQAEITRVESRALEIAGRRAELVAAVNALGDRRGETLENLVLPGPRLLELALDALRSRSAARPELAAADARIARREIQVRLAEKSFRPDLQVGLSYTLVDRRRDEAGRANPPDGDGDDVLAFSAGANLPVRKRKLEAGLQEALHHQSAAGEEKRAALAAIDRDLAELTARLPLLYRQWKLLDGVLTAQAEEALSSAEAAYSTGKLTALDLLDAEHVLFEVRTAAARTRADWAIAHARLEGAVGASLHELGKP